MSQQTLDAEPSRDRTMVRLRDFMQTESASAGLLVAASLIALLWANSPWSEAYFDLWHTTAEMSIGDSRISMDLHHWVNDALMVLFFFVIGLEVRREFAIGELTERRRIVVPLVAGIGGMLVPAAIYLALNPSGEAAAGWGAVIGTDTAFLLGVLALVGPRISSQLRIFLLTLTVIDDVVAVSVIGIVYTDEVRIVPLVIAGAALVGIAVLDRMGQWRASPYVGLVLVAWLATLQAGLHASIAGMVAGLLVPAAEPARSLVEQAARRVRDFRQSPLPGVQRDARAQLTRAVSINERLQEALHGWAGYVIVPVFALANAGVDLRGGLLGEALRSPVTWGVVLGLVGGKLLGIWLGSLAAVRGGWGSLPQGVGLGHVAAGGALSGIGFTVSLLIIGLAFDDGPVRDQATVGVLLSVVVASAVGWLVFRFAAKYLGQTDAALPTTLSVPVDPDVDHVWGPRDAPMTLVEYLDYECPFCARATGAAHEVKTELGTRLRYVVRHLPLDVHPHAWPAALAVEAANRQGKFWEMHELLFRNQDELEVEDLAGYAAELGLDVEDFLRDMDDDELVARVRRDLESAEESGARGTPTFFIGDQRHEGAFDARTLVAALEASAVIDGDRGYRRIH